MSEEYTILEHNLATNQVTTRAMSQPEVDALLAQAAEAASREAERDAESASRARAHKTLSEAHTDLYSALKPLLKD